MVHTLGRQVDAVTFDCWGTLLAFERERPEGRHVRELALERAVRAAGLDLSEAEIRERLSAAHSLHTDQWESARESGSPDMARWALEPLGITDPAVTLTLVREFEEAALAEDVRPLDGAVDTLRALSERNIRLALVCDTGFSPGRIVRQLLDRVGLLEWLEVQIFSNEVGLPKPNAPVFHAALEGLHADPGNAVHVGDLLRTDIAGAREVGMGTVRIRHFNDDPADLPEADAVADSHAHLREILGL